jgi:beta-mannosidase
LFVWSGNNENEAAIAQNWFDIPKTQLNRVKDDYRILYVETIMRAVQQIDRGSNRPFITSSPTNGLKSIEENYIATDPNDPLYGKCFHFNIDHVYLSLVIIDIR